MARGLTALKIEHEKPGNKRREIRDPDARGLYLIVEPSGFKSFAVRYRFDGKPRKLSLGNISLSKARKAAADAYDEVAQGRDPTAAKQQAKAERRGVAANTFERVADRYFTSVFSNGKMRTAQRQLADLKRLVLPTLGRKPISEIKRSQINGLLDEIDDNSGPVMADRTLATIRKIMNWYAIKADDFRSPIVKGMARTKGSERARDRILTDDEILKVWNASAEGPFPALIKFLLLTAARRDEGARMTWSEIRGNEWELPAARNKTKLDLIRPLTPAALAVSELQRRPGSLFVFTTDGKTPISAFSKFKAKFDAATGTAGWTLHDLRRTARSLMSRAGVLSDHAERCLGHVIGGVRKTYDRFEYRDEKRDAYNKLAALISQITSPPPASNVTKLERKKKRA